MKRLLFIAPVALLIAGVIYLANYEVKSAEIAPTQATEQVKAPEPIKITMLDANTLYKMVNEERTENGVKALKTYKPLVETAQERADDMLTRDYFSHYDPETGVKMINTQDAGCGISENIALTDGIDRNESAISMTLGSVAHRNAMLNKSYDAIGIGISGNYAVFHFCDLE